MTDIKHESSLDPPDLPPKQNRSSQHSLNVGGYEPSTLIPPPPKFSTSGAIQSLSQDQFPQVSGSLTYAELEHHRYKNTKTTKKKNPDVLYSEIKVLYS